MSTIASQMKAAAKIHMPPMNPNDPFFSKLALVAVQSPEKLLARPLNADTPPYLDIFDSPQLMSSPAQKTKPHDLTRAVPSLLPQGVDLLTKMLKYNLAERIATKTALDHPYFDSLDKSQF